MDTQILLRKTFTNGLLKKPPGMVLYEPISRSGLSAAIIVAKLLALFRRDL
jgi:hypothetical protein